MAIGSAVPLSVSRAKSISSDHQESQHGFTRSLSALADTLPEDFGSPVSDEMMAEMDAHLQAIKEQSASDYQPHDPDALPESTEASEVEDLDIRLKDFDGDATNQELSDWMEIVVTQSSLLSNVSCGKDCSSASPSMPRPGSVNDAQLSGYDPAIRDHLVEAAGEYSLIHVKGPLMSTGKPERPDVPTSGEYSAIVEGGQVEAALLPPASGAGADSPGVRPIRARLCPGADDQLPQDSGDETDAAGPRRPGGESEPTSSPSLSNGAKSIAASDSGVDTGPTISSSGTSRPDYWKSHALILASTDGARSKS